MSEILGYIDFWITDDQTGNKPHYKGFVKLHGIKYEFGGWPAKSGKPGVFSGTLKLPRENPPTEEPVAAAPQSSDHDIPF